MEVSRNFALAILIDSYCDMFWPRVLIAGAWSIPPLIFGALMGWYFYNYFAAKQRQKIFSDITTFEVVEKAMLKPILVTPPFYPELCAQAQNDMVRKFVFSKKAKLVLIEGAQGKF